MQIMHFQERINAKIKIWRRAILFISSLFVLLTKKVDKINFLITKDELPFLNNVNYTSPYLGWTTKLAF